MSLFFYDSFFSDIMYISYSISLSHAHFCVTIIRISSFISPLSLSLSLSLFLSIYLSFFLSLKPSHTCPHTLIHSLCIKYIHTYAFILNQTWSLAYSETLDGLSTIRAYRSESRFRAKNDLFLDNNQKAFFLNFRFDQQLHALVCLDFLKFTRAFYVSVLLPLAISFPSTLLLRLSFFFSLLLFLPSLPFTPHLFFPPFISLSQPLSHCLFSLFLSLLCSLAIRI